MNPLKLFSAFGEIGIKDTGAMNHLQNVDNAGSKLNNTMGAMFKRIGLVAGAFAVGFLTRKTIQEFEALETGLAKISTMMAGDSNSLTARMKELKGEVQSLQIITGKSSAEITEGMYQILSAFGDIPEAMELTTIASKVSVAGNTSLASSVDFLSAVMKGYNDVSVESAQVVSDMAFQVVKLGQTEMPELAKSMQLSIPLASTLKISYGELFGAIATLTGVTGGASEVNTQLRAVFTSMTQPTKELSDVVSSLGYESAFAMMQQEGLAGTLNLLKDAVGGSEEKMIQFFGSVEATNLVLALTGAQSENFAQKTALMFESAGATAEAYEKQMNTLTMSKQRFNQAMNVVAANIGTYFGPVIRKVIDAVVGDVETAGKRINDFFANMEKGFKAIGKWVSETFGPLGKLIGEEWDKITNKFKKTPEEMEITQAKLLVVWDKISAGLKGLVNKLVNMYRDWYAKNKDAVDAVFGAFSKFWELLQVGWTAIVGWATVFWEKYGKSIWETISVFLDLAGRAFKVFFNTLQNVFDFFIKIFKGDWSGAWEAFKKIFIDLWNDMGEYLGVFWDYISKVLKTAWQIIKDGFGVFMHNLWVAVRKGSANILGGFIGMIEGMIGGLERLTSKIPFLSKVFGNIKQSFADYRKGLEDNASELKYESWLGSTNELLGTHTDLLKKLKEIRERKAKSLGAETDALKGLGDATEDAGDSAEGAGSQFSGLGDAVGGVADETKRAKEELDKFKEAIGKGIGEINTIADLVYKALKAMIEYNIEQTTKSFEHYLKFLDEKRQETLWVNKEIFEDEERKYNELLRLAEQERDEKLYLLDREYDDKVSANERLKDDEELNSRERVRIIENEYDERRDSVNKYYNDLIGNLEKELDLLKAEEDEEKAQEKLERREERAESLSERLGNAIEKYEELKKKALEYNEIEEAQNKVKEAQLVVEELRKELSLETDDKNRKRIEDQIKRAEEQVKRAEEQVKRAEENKIKLDKDVERAEKDVERAEKDIDKEQKDIEKEDRREQRDKEKEDITEEIRTTEQNKADAQKSLDELEQTQLQYEDNKHNKIIENIDKETEEHRKSVEARKEFAKIEYDEKVKDIDQDWQKKKRIYQDWLNVETTKWEEITNLINAEKEGIINSYKDLLKQENLFELAKEYFDPNGEKSIFALFKTWLPEAFDAGKTFGEKWLEGLGFVLSSDEINEKLLQTVTGTLSKVGGELDKNKEIEEAPSAERPKDDSGLPMYDWEIEKKKDEEQYKEQGKAQQQTIVVNQYIDGSKLSESELEKTAKYQLGLAMQEWTAQNV